jgi:DNA-binding FrmR family transcriptional regulator
MSSAKRPARPKKATTAAKTGGAASGHAHGPEGAADSAKIVARLRTVEGHLRGITQMVQDNAYCIDILRQTKAVQAAIGRIEAALLERHLDHCVSRAIRSDDEESRARVIQEIVEVFEAARRG